MRSKKRKRKGKSTPPPSPLEEELSIYLSSMDKEISPDNPDQLHVRGVILGGRSIGYNTFHSPVVKAVIAALNLPSDADVRMINSTIEQTLDDSMEFSASLILFGAMQVHNSV